LAAVSKKPGIDALKGALILMVMLGHMAELADARHMAHWIGAGFRMPLMVGISGYMLNLDRVRSGTFINLFDHYRDRMLLPWAIAVMLYAVVGGWPLSWTTPIDFILRPPFHLWYIPVLFALILTARLLPLPPLALLVLGAPVSLATIYAFGLDHGPMGTGLFSPDCRFLSYALYFFFGMVLARSRMTAYQGWLALGVAMLGLLWWIQLFDTREPMAVLGARLMMSLGLVALLPFVSVFPIRLAPLAAIGKVSLFYYLWHPMAIGLALAGGLSAPLAFGAALAGLVVVHHLLGTLPTLATWLGVSYNSRPRLTPSLA
jgi:acyltransferase